MTRARSWAWFALAAGACGGAQVGAGAKSARLGAEIPDVTLPGTDGHAHAVRAEAAAAHFTVFEFFSAECPVQRSHDERLKELSARYRDRGIAVFPVDTESGASIERDASEASSRGYVFPILRDERGALADALGATYATFVVVVDDKGRVRYRGGIDTDKQRLHDDRAPYLDNAVAELLAGRDPNPAETRSLGCYLRRW